MGLTKGIKVARSSMLHVRVDDGVKDQAAQALAAMGLTVSEAVRLFLNRVAVAQKFPLERKVPNPETQAAMAEARRLMLARQARFATPGALFNALEEASQR